VICLLDVNVLVALAWPNHVHHAAAVGWFTENHSRGWATCPITESGFIRVSSNRRVIPDARTPTEAGAVLRAFRALPGHQFWPDDVSLCEDVNFPLSVIHGYRQVTDAHLLSLAMRRGGSLVTFDVAAAELGRQTNVPIQVLPI